MDKTTLRRRQTFAGDRLQAVRRHGKRLALIGAAATMIGANTALAGLAGASMAQAGGRVDQQNPFTTDTSRFGQGIRSSAASGQTFTAGVTGSLDRVAVYLDPVQDEPLEPATVFLDIYPTDANGIPRTDGAALGSGRAPTPDPENGADFVTIALSHPAAVKKGKTYAIVLHSDVDLEFSLSWKGSAGSNLYPRGVDVERFDANGPWQALPGDDYFFKTFVTPHRQRHK